GLPFCNVLTIALGAPALALAAVAPEGSGLEALVGLTLGARGAHGGTLSLWAIGRWADARLVLARTTSAAGAEAAGAAAGGPNGSLVVFKGVETADLAARVFAHGLHMPHREAFGELLEMQHLV
ncbi:hypothetical protein T492DRAFT_864175, partial [Pavlovales sp. CCMP2436]